MIDRRSLILALPMLGYRRAIAAPPPYRARLIGGERDGATWMAGVDIALDDGWKTYWRIPGEGGIPPSFDWGGSRGTTSIDVLWPAPRRFNDASGETIGYRHRVVFPVRVVTAGDEPPELKLAMFFGVCKEVCIPARFSGTLAADRAVPSDLSLLQTFAAQIPERRPFVTSARIADGALTMKLAPDVPSDPDLFVESDTLAYLRAPEKSGDGYKLGIDGLKDPLSLGGKTVRVTLVAGEHRLEQDVTVE